MEFQVSAFCVPSVMLPVFLIMEAVKYLTRNRTACKPLIPLMAALTGMLIGGVFFAIGNIPFMPHTFGESLYMGLCSGLCAIGADQLIRKSLKTARERKNEKDREE